MLVLTRKPGESLRIGSGVKVTLVSCGSGQARIAIDAPREVSILREELYQKTASANLVAASTPLVLSGCTGFPGISGKATLKENRG